MEQREKNLHLDAERFEFLLFAMRELVEPLIGQKSSGSLWKKTRKQKLLQSNTALSNIGYFTAAKDGIIQNG